MLISIRAEQPKDIDSIHELNTLIFGQDNEANLVDMLRGGPDFIPALSLVAIADDTIIGYVLLSRVGIINGDIRHQSLALAPIAVHPQYRKRGIASKLITSALQIARDLDFRSVVVLGHEHYYPKFGFVAASRWGIKAPVEVPDNVFMAMELIPGSLLQVSGTVEFPVEFSTI
jgi:putative acetyltransferase